MAKRKTSRKKAVKAEEEAPKKSKMEFKLAVAILIFGTATAFSAIYKLGNITILLGLVTAAAALAMTLKRK